MPPATRTSSPTQEQSNTPPTIPSHPVPKNVAEELGLISSSMWSPQLRTMFPRSTGRQYKRREGGGNEEELVLEKPQCASMAACFHNPFKRKGVRGLSPKARRYERPEDLSVCVLRMRFFEREVEEEKRLLRKQKIRFCSAGGTSARINFFSAVKLHGRPIGRMRRDVNFDLEPLESVA
ncbi:hypothetical protein BDZ45DRAFT_736647 [Acephala macrosclerotiorum]|nr:hypothetical protein BDZ45DRAFT_736647 [Acephala macrosclerotiorum]